MLAAQFLINKKQKLAFSVPFEAVGVWAPHSRWRAEDFGRSTWSFLWRSNYLGHSEPLIT